MKLQLGLIVIRRNETMTDVRNSHIMLVLTAVVAMSCCGEADLVQPYAPNANNHILWESIIGEEESWSSIWEITLDSGANIYFAGNLDYKECIGKVSSGGHLEWTYATDYYINEIYIIHFPPLSMNEALLICGGMDTNGNDRPDIGVVSVMDLDGSVIIEGYIEREEEPLTIYEAVLLEESESQLVLMLGGTVNSEDVLCPYLNKLRISEAGEFSVIQSEVFSDYPDKSIRYLTWNENPADPRYFAGVAHYSSDVWKRSSIFCYSDSMKVLWNKQVHPSGSSRTYFYQLRYHQGFVYGVGPALIQHSGEYTYTGFASALTESGDVIWARKIRPSGLEDVLDALYVDENGIYAVGRYSIVTREITNHRFGYGLLTRFDNLTGSISLLRIFGGRDYYSSFIDICVSDGRIFCGGSTHYYLGGYWRKAWLVEVSDEEGLSESCLPIDPDDPELVKCRPDHPLDIEFEQKKIP